MLYVSLVFNADAPNQKVDEQCYENPTMLQDKTVKPKSSKKTKASNAKETKQASVVVFW